MGPKVKGSICGILAAVCYGTNPLGALPLLSQGIQPYSVIFYRFSIAVVLLGSIMAIQRHSFAVTRRELAIMAALGVLFASSSLTLYASFLYMDAGVASTLLFVYPVMVAVIMTVFFHERLTIVTVLSIVLALSGIMLLSKGGNGSALSMLGIVLVMVSSLTYAVYIVAVNRSMQHMPSFRLSFYVMVFASLTVLAFSFCGNNQLQLLSGFDQWGLALMLAVIPTVMSLVLMAVAVHNIGSTPTAIMGALEPLTAVVIGITVFGEAFTSRLAVGILMILGAVMLIVAMKR